MQGFEGICETLGKDSWDLWDFWKGFKGICETLGKDLQGFMIDSLIFFPTAFFFIRIFPHNFFWKNFFPQLFPTKLSPAPLFFFSKIFFLTIVFLIMFFPTKFFWQFFSNQINFSFWQFFLPCNNFSRNRQHSSMNNHLTAVIYSLSRMKPVRLFVTFGWGSYKYCYILKEYFLCFVGVSGIHSEFAWIHETLGNDSWGFVRIFSHKNYFSNKIFQQFFFLTKLFFPTIFFQKNFFSIKIFFQQFFSDNYFDIFFLAIFFFLTIFFPTKFFFQPKYFSNKPWQQFFSKKMVILQTTLFHEYNITACCCDIFLKCNIFMKPARLCDIHWGFHLVGIFPVFCKSFTWVEPFAQVSLFLYIYTALFHK